MTEWQAIWRKRLNSFWREALLYGSYAVQGGLGAFLLLCFVIGGYFYIRWLAALSPTFPYWRLTTPLFAVALGASPIRTFLRDVDLVFLMPAEGKMKGYFRSSVIYSFALQGAGTAVLLLAVWPLYVRCRGPEAASFSLMLVFLLIGKLLSVVGRWEESRLLVRGQRLCVTAMRWLAAVVFAYAAFKAGPLAAAACLTAFALPLAGVLRLLPRQTAAWTYWLAVEKKQRARRYLFYSWFADVPQLPKRIKARNWAANWLERIPFGQDSAYVYLYGKTFIRSDLFAIWARITLLAAVLLIVFPSDAVRLAVYGIAAALSAIQASTLKAAHRYAFWPKLYPLNAELRERSAGRVAAAVLLAGNAALGALLTALSEHRLYALLAVLAAISWGPIVVRRRRSGAADSDLP